jgi:hypothetical protein
VIARFLEQVRFDAYDAAHEVSDGDLRLTALLETILSRLEDAGIVADPQLAFFKRESRNLHAEVHAYSVDSEDDVLLLFYFVDGNASEPFDAPWTPQPVGKDTVARGLKRLEAFLRFVESGRAEEVEESTPAFELMSLVKESLAEGRKIAFCLITTGILSDRAIVAGSDAAEAEAWDLLRLGRVCGGTGDEALSIDFASDFACTLPCLTTVRAPDGLQVLLTAIPGEILATIYNTYRSRVLERNVRSFLQFTGKVNQGIRETILERPSRFLPYNNGLAATASAVEMDDLGDGLARIRAVRDFQIVNGGQTTASLAAAVRRDDADVSGLSVAMKLTIVPPDQVDELVPLIARFANTQNRIQEADFSANHPWHVALERLSRATWTTPADGAPRGTRWYYERSRGQFGDELAAVSSPAAKRRFRDENPNSQRFTKTDFAKFVLSWDQKPDIVSRGAQKAFVAFMKQLGSAGRAGPERSDFQRIAALGLLFRTAERLYGQLGFTGYRAQVVTFAIARLSQIAQKRLPWDEIWSSQCIPQTIADALKILLIGIREIVINPPGGRNITEWCKREECLSGVMQTEFDIRLPGLDEWQPYSLFSNAVSTTPPATGPLLESVVSIPSDVWFAVSAWARERRALQSWQRSLAYSVGKLVGMRKTPSLKQAAQGRKLMLKAIDDGYVHTDLTQERIDALAAAPEA